MLTHTEQIIVGKIPQPELSGQLSLFNLPSNFSWLQYFSASEMAQFFTELLDALTQS